MEIKPGAPITTAGQERVATYVYDGYEIVGPAPEISEPALTDEIVDAFLNEHEDDPVDDAQLERVRRRFNEKVGHAALRTPVEGEK